MKKIEYPELKKIGGFKNLILKIVVKVLVIVLISSSLGWLSGYLVQKSFRDVIEFNKSEPVITEVQEVQEDAQEIENGAVRMISGALSVTSDAIEAVTNSEIMQSASEASRKVISDALKPLVDLLNAMFDFLERVLFWMAFVLAFLITAWMTNKIFLILGKRSLTDGTDPQVIKNMEVLEVKVKELVDNANGDEIN